MFGGFDRDPIFGAHHRAMNRMMNSFMGGDIFGGMMDPGQALMGPSMMNHNDLMPFNNSHRGGRQVGLPGAMFGGFGFPDIGQMMNMDPGSNGMFMSSSTMVTMSPGPDGRPQVYQSSSQMRQGPGGVKETRKSEMDSRSGTKREQMGRHIGERGHVKEREENLRTGQRDDHEELINIDERQAREFNQEWRQRANGFFPGSTPTYNAIEDGGSRRPRVPQQAESVRPPSAPSATHGGGVTIEELPPSDDEEPQVTPTPPPQTSSSSTQGRRHRIPLISSSSHRRSSPQISSRRLGGGSKSTKKSRK